ncbi:MAG TPA: hypothetical protein VGC88_05055, partial [Terriglobales bacterium]
MIRINLLGANTGKGKRGKRSGAPAIVIVPTDGPSPLLTGMLVFLVAAATSGWFYVHANHEHEELAKQMSSAQREAESLRGVKQRFEKRKQEADEYERRVRVIETLRLNQSGPVDMMSTMADTVNH